MNEKYIITTFYKFVDLPDYMDVRVKFVKFCNEYGIKGTILLAPEGLNSTLTGTREAIDAFYAFMKAEPRFADIEYKESFAEFMPFGRMKVRLKKEIVRFKVDDLDPSQAGKYLDAKDWDEMIQRENAIVIDTRNDFEVAFGTFKGAMDPKTRHFSDLPKWVEDNFTEEDKERPVAMFCTGGIRCEKSTAYMKKAGFKDVYHLKGGILQYLEDTQERENLWEGDCFVFDDRITVDKQLRALDERS